MTETVRVALHLGAHKTGTSLIQKYMRDRPQEMARMRAVPIPRSDCNTLIGWGRVPQDHPALLREAVLAAARGPRPVDRLRRVRPARGWTAALRPPRTVIVSHENSLGAPFQSPAPGLYPAARDCADGLRASLDGLDTHVVYYIRSQDEFLESFYLQTVHQGGTTGFDEWIGTLDTSALSWVPAVTALADAFGADRVAVRDFAEIRRGQNEFLAHFLRTCDPRLDPRLDYRPMRNISVSQQGLELALVMNPLLRTPQERKAVRTFLQATFNNATGFRPLLLGEEAKADLRRRYQEENDALLERFPGPWTGPA